MKCKHYISPIEGEFVKDRCDCNGDLPDEWIDVLDHQLSYWMQRCEYMENLISGHGGAIDEVRLEWIEHNPQPPKEDSHV